MAHRFGDRVKDLLAKQVDCHGSENRHIGQGMTITPRSFILVQHHLFDPMQAIFNLPLSSNLLGKGGSTV